MARPIDLASPAQRLLADRGDGQAYAALVEGLNTARAAGETNPLLKTAGLKVALVTASNARFMPITSVLLDSVPPDLRRGAIDLCVLDVGLDDSDRAQLSARGCHVVEPGWDIDFPGRPAAKPHFRAMVSRPFLPRHFPGRDICIWIDADAWIQEGDGLDDYVLAALRYDVAVVPEISPTYTTHFRLDVEPDRDFSVVEWNRRAYRKYFGERASRTHGDRPLINSGVVAGRADSPHWAAWAEAMAVGLRRAPDTELSHTFVEQTALNQAIFDKGLPHAFLPATHNWAAHRADPVVDLDRGLLCEPMPPYHPIRILHLTGPKKMDSVRLQAIDGSRVDRSVASFVVKRQAD